jgi:broad specificity phosphatase PhoE
MGHLFLVRHAQASFLSSNYDRLSSLGEQQARSLGEHWAHRRFRLDRAVCGPAVRHRDTARIVGEAYQSAGLPVPPVVVAPEFDEFQGEAVLSAALPKLMDGNETVRALNQAMQQASSDTEKRTSFERLFEAVITSWVDGQFVVDSVESWPAFCERVNRGLETFLSQAQRGETSVIFTSGGPIAVVVQRSLRLAQSDTLKIAWMSRNSSYTEFLFSRERLTLSSFNAFPHLPDDRMLTYR